MRGAPAGVVRAAEARVLFPVLEEVVEKDDRPIGGVDASPIEQDATRLARGRGDLELGGLETEEMGGHLLLGVVELPRGEVVDGLGRQYALERVFHK